MTGREDKEKDKEGVKKRRREDKVMSEGSKKAGKAGDRGKEEKEGR